MRGARLFIFTFFCSFSLFGRAEIRNAEIIEVIHREYIEVGDHIRLELKLKGDIPIVPGEEMKLSLYSGPLRDLAKKDDALMSLKVKGNGDRSVSWEYSYDETHLALSYFVGKYLAADVISRDVEVVNVLDAKTIEGTSLTKAILEFDKTVENERFILTIGDQSFSVAPPAGTRGQTGQRMELVWDPKYTKLKADKIAGQKANLAKF